MKYQDQRASVLDKSAAGVGVHFYMEHKGINYTRRQFLRTNHVPG